VFKTDFRHTKAERGVAGLLNWANLKFFEMCALLLVVTITVAYCSRFLCLLKWR
jgi:hypothetical protein